MIHLTLRRRNVDRVEEEPHVPDMEDSRNRLLSRNVRHPYIDLPNFVDHLTRKPYAYTTRCKCKITRFNLASRETGIKRFRAWTHHWAQPLRDGLGDDKPEKAYWNHSTQLTSNKIVEDAMYILLPLFKVHLPLNIGML